MSLFELGRSLKNLKETEEKFPVYSLSNQGNSPHGDSWFSVLLLSKLLTHEMPSSLVSFISKYRTAITGNVCVKNTIMNPVKPPVSHI